MNSEQWSCHIPITSPERGLFKLGRMPRTEYYGGVYHVIHKGRFDIFINDEDKIKFLGILAETKEKFDFKFLAYCIIDDEYNLLIKTHNIPISKIVQRINMLYANYFNKRYNSSGSVFKGRYKGIIIKEQHYLLNIIKYIHNIPVYSNIIKTMDEFKWSSDMFYRLNMESIVDIELILDMLSDERYPAIAKYSDLMITHVGEYEFINGYYEERIQEVDKPKDKTLELDDILRKVCVSNLDFNLIKNGSKRSYLMKFKGEYIMESVNLGFSKFDIGRNIKITDRAVRKYLNK